MSISRSPFACVLLVNLTMLVAACDSGGCVETPLNPCDEGGTTPVPTILTLSMATVTFSALGETQQLGVTVLDQDGQTIPSPSVSWVSSLPSVASVSTAGLVTAESDGMATITATSGSASGTAAVTVDVPPVLLPSQLCTDFSPSAIATFADGSLETVVRAAVGLAAQDDLTCGLLAVLTALDANDLGISDLRGIQNLTSLTELALLSNSITDVSPLASLTNLVTVLMSGNSSLKDISSLSTLTSLDRLELSGNAVLSISAVSGMTSLTELDLEGNLITDVSPLSGRSSLIRLGLNGNNIADIGPLSSLTNLIDLTLGDTGRSDISALSGLTALQFLFLHNNSITDVSPLQGLTRLAYIDLEGNPSLSNIQPLLNNTGLGSGDEVLIGSTAVACTDVAALEAKGVTVSSDCSLVTFRIEGTVDLVQSPLSPLFSLGDAFAITYAFDPSTPDDNVATQRGLYSAFLAVEISVGSYLCSVDLGVLAQGTISVDNDLNSTDQYRIDLFESSVNDTDVGSLLGCAAVGGFNVSNQTALMQMHDPSGTALSGDALPTTPLDPNDFSGGGTFLALAFYDPTTCDGFPFSCQASFVTANIESFTAN